MPKIRTTKGEMDESLLEKKALHVDDHHESTEIDERWLGGTVGHDHKALVAGAVNTLKCACGAEQVHRSVHVTLKKPGLIAWGTAASMGK